MVKQKPFFVTLLSLLLCFSLFSCDQANNQQAPDEPEKQITELTTPVEKLSYALGMQVGNSIKMMQAELDLPTFHQAIKDQFNGKETLLTMQEATEIQRTSFRKMHEERSNKNKTEGTAFLNENKKKEGITETKSGLQYEVLSEGDGPVPEATDRVKVHYVGTLIDGTEFDSSLKRNKPAAFSLKGVIRGWTEALQLMKVGSKYRLFIPPELAYGQRGSPPKIPPNATLIFEVELLEIVGKTPEKQADKAAELKETEKKEAAPETVQ